MINLGTPGAPRLTFLSACAFETGCRGPAACSWHPCSRCLRVGREQGSGQTQEGVTNRPSLPWTKGFPGTRTLRAKPGRTPGKPGQLVKQALSSRTHPSQGTANASSPAPSWEARNTAPSPGLGSLDSPSPGTLVPHLLSLGPSSTRVGGSRGHGAPS